MARSRITRHLASSTLFVLLLGAAIEANDNALTRQTLRGLTVMDVVVESLDSQAEKIGLTDTNLQTDVELKLRLAGIRVSEDDASRIAASPYLYVHVNLGLTSGTSVIYAVTIAFNQTAQLADPTKSVSDPLAFTERRRTIAETWSVSGIGTVGTARAEQGIRSVVKDMLDQFVNAWLSANPR